MSVSIQKVNRRSFLKTGAMATGGLILGFYLPESNAAVAEPAPGTAAALNAYIHIAPDDTVTLFIHKAEMGQGTVTSLSMLLAEELECDWTKIRTEFPGVDPAYGPMQGVVGSQSVRSSWEALRKAGAVACEMLIQAAAEKWNVPRSQCRAENGSIINLNTNSRLSYGSLAEAASKLQVPPAAALKDRSMFRLLGKPMKRLDTPIKVNGKAPFALDMRLPGMLYAVVARCPVFGGTVTGFDASKTNAVPGVRKVVQISSGVAVVAENTWSANQGRKVLDIHCDEGRNADRTSAQIQSIFAELAQRPGAVARKEGDAETALSSALKKIDAVYQVPYLAHAPMEPLNCTADVRSDSCEVWAGTQMQTAARQAAARAAGLAPERVQVHTTYLGGGFGRRARVDFISEAVEVSKAIGAPVKLTWTREDDLQQDYYRPASYTHFAGGLDAQGWPVALTARIACPSFGGLRNGVDRTGVEGIAEMAYGIPNIHVDYHPPDVGIPVSYWRSVGYSQNTFFTESFIDELAAAGKKDPVELRRRLLAHSARHLGVIDLAVEKSGWGKPLPSGRFLGIALSDNVGSFNAQVAEVSVDKGTVRVHRVTCAVDCGHVVNPSGVVQQVRSAIIYGLSAALMSEITIDKGRVQQHNFDKYEVLRMDEAPVIDVYIVPSTNPPGGIGEAATPPIAGAVANAVFGATGKRIRQLPIRPADLA
jgi:isoquinoline 1-oxidoreductase subunit beta